MVSLCKLWSPATLALLLLTGCPATNFDGDTQFGGWKGEVQVDQQAWAPGQKLKIRGRLQVTKGHFERMAQAGYPVDKVMMLVTAERTFDTDGWMRFASDEKMSTLLTPTGLAIEGGIQGPVTDRFGYPFRTPVDELVEMSPDSMVTPFDMKTAVFEAEPTLPADLPPGLYRLRVDFGVKTKGNYRDLGAYSLGSRPFPPYDGSYLYSGVFQASGKNVSGVDVDGTQIQARIPWTLLANYNSNGYQGVVADEDQGRFALSPRNLIPDEVVLPLYYGGGTSVVSYSLEPSFPADSVDSRRNIEWSWNKGELSLEVTAPDGTTTPAVTAPIVDRTSSGNPTTKDPAFTSWKPIGYGKYTVKLTGWIEDRAGRRYQGGGTYHFWIAKRLTMATATFQGMPYPVNYAYGRDIGFSPPVPAVVDITATLYPGSDTALATTATSHGTATPGGIFGVAQGMVQLSLSAPGEYHAKILAQYTDPEGHLWVCAMRHSGVVYATDSTIVARGKKINVGGTYVDRGSTGREGSTGHLEHLGFPYNSHDILLVASEGQGANKIEPVLIYENKGENPAWDTKLNGVGTSNLYIRTSNSYSPHLYPEYITDKEYYYASAARPGFVPRFIVGESIVRAPYWPTSPNSFGGQIGPGYNGDSPGDIYRLMGGVVMRDQGKSAVYADYLASAFVLPKGTNNNRVIEPGSEDLTGSTGERARFFLVGFRPGMAVEMTGDPPTAKWKPAVQVDPILPGFSASNVTFSLTFPDGHSEAVDVADSAYDAVSGTWVKSSVYTLNQEGVYRYKLTASWQGHDGGMPGLPASVGEFYAYSSAKRPAAVNGLVVDLPNQSTFAASDTLTVTGSSTATSVHYALIMPGAVLDQGELTVSGGHFQYVVDPAALNRLAPIYDIRSITTGQPQIGRVLHLSFFAQETYNSTSFWDFRRVIVRGTTVLSTK